MKNMEYYRHSFSHYRQNNLTITIENCNLIMIISIFEYNTKIIYINIE